MQVQVSTEPSAVASSGRKAGDDRPDPTRVHAEHKQRFDSECGRRQAQSDRLSLARLFAFVAAAALITTGLRGAGIALWLGIGSALLFVAAVIVQQKVIAAKDDARVRSEVHARHLMRVSSEWTQLPCAHDRLLPATHPYAWDIDLLGRGSLLQRIDVTRTVHGERTLCDWLGRPASPELARARQAAVNELAGLVELRQELEAAALIAQGGEKLDGRPFREFAELPSYFAPRPWLTPLIFALPLLTLATYLAGLAHLLPAASWLLPLCAQVGLLWMSARPVRRAFDLAAARQGTVEAFERMLVQVERASFGSPLLRALQERLAVDGTPPSVHMRRLKAWTSSAELRQQFLFYIVVGPLTLWDLHVLRGLERWNARVGRKTADWFAALGELEALCSLATLRFVDPGTSLPELLDGTAGLRAEGLSHPLLLADARVPNDVALAGPGCALIVTGSNMAGKSTLLRALGLNVALALAGGPVTARAMSVPLVRLRASMRAEDSLQEGASYFLAEVTKLKTVVQDASDAPPILFLLDELLRGTNARARHLGARSVIVHLIERGAMGLVATHDVALSALEKERPGRVHNVHFTDVVEDSEMRFDYRLRAGVVRTSNALRLLAMAGIDVPKDDDLPAEPLPHRISPSERS